MERLHRPGRSSHSRNPLTFSTFAFLFSAFLFTLPSIVAAYQHVLSPAPNALSVKSLTLKHIYHHGVSPETIGFFRRLDIDPSDEDFFAESEVMASTARDNVVRLSSPNAKRLYRRRPPVGTKFFLNDTRAYMDLFETRLITLDDDDDDDDDQTKWPDLNDPPTVLSLAKMSNNAYTDPKKVNSTYWYDLGEKWPINKSFGWETSGMRGHVFGDVDNTTFVIAFKGTSAGLFCGSIDTCQADKFNDNHLFSCCTARLGWRWNPIYECASEPKTCNHTCVEQTLGDSKVHYWAALAIANEVMDAYENATVWFTGHSLGGSIASLTGLTFGIPVVTFQAPGERFAAARLHLPFPPAVPFNNTPIWHLGHNADPIFLGSCNTFSRISYCYSGGYDMETHCHTGNHCVFDVVEKMGKSLDFNSHGIQYTIDNVLTPWKWDEWGFPDCKVQMDVDEDGNEVDCADCKGWKFEH